MAKKRKTESTLDHMYEGADGVKKRLGDFTLEDVDAMIERHKRERAKCDDEVTRAYQLRGALVARMSEDED